MFKEYNRLKSLANSPELFENKREDILNDFFNSISCQKTRDQLKETQELLDANNQYPLHIKIMLLTKLVESKSELIKLILDNKA